jgi:hypothetical protein
MIQYRAIFDVAQTQFSHWSSLVYAVIFWIITLGLIGYQFRAGWCPHTKKMIPWTLFLIFFSSFGTFTFYTTYQNYLTLKSALQQSQCLMVEGKVDGFHLQQWKNHADDVFSVNGLEFIYNSQGGMQNGFHQGGIIHNGMQVRIYYLGLHPDITRLEIAP